MALKLVEWGTCVRDGWRVQFRHGSAWALLAGALLLSAIARFTPLPFRAPGQFSLSAFAGILQLTATLLVVAFLTRRGYRHLREWWPIPLSLGLVARSLGAWAGMAAGLAVLVALQLLLAALSGDLRIDDGARPEPLDLTPAYLRMLLAGVVFALVLLVWGQLLVIALGRTGGLLGLFVLVFAGFLLPDLTARQPALLPLLGILPDLGSLSPLATVDRPEGNLVGLVPYVPLHVAQTMALTVVIISIKRVYGRSIDQPEPTP